MKKIKKIAILTSGGDAPGMNSAIRAAAKMARSQGIETFLVYEGYKGLVEDNIINSTQVDLDFFNSWGGTCIYSARYPQFKDPDVREIAIKNLHKRKIDALIVIGGDGSYAGAQLLHEKGIKTIGLPGTIDNDIASSDYTIGYDTALNTVVRSIDQIRDTASSHKRIMIIEVMGNHCGDLALHSGLATGAEIIATSEYRIDEKEIINNCVKITSKASPMRRNISIVVSEKLYDIKQLAKDIEKATGWSTRANVLGHLQRGGNPSAQERILASLFGIKAVECLLEGKSGVAIGIINNDIIALPITEALSMENKSKAKVKEKAIKFNELNQLD
ncbi:6-phosphofructokinase [Mycoplasmopsis caviae]|uniref:ATP-dependent 6-phosphofructokinase n=1 Tax=Mycoplasmopsis caviae TaxID=55603 RepID=A0A3P8MFD0_9BACT|nr:6-phosphofructokinase [Mycoplasmopsis caviae]UUD35744.1 6-phosphofructokinase [Mycoplasmopsis caviae]VDR42393.1 6-phosphofructokinase [Mycoplasmopsis caviae]